MDGPEEEMDPWSTTSMRNNMLHLKSETSPISTEMTRIARCQVNILASWPDCLVLRACSSTDCPNSFTAQHGESDDEVSDNED